MTMLLRPVLRGGSGARGQTPSPALPISTYDHDAHCVACINIHESFYLVLCLLFASGVLRYEVDFYISSSSFITFLFAWQIVVILTIHNLDMTLADISLTSSCFVHWEDVLIKVFIWSHITLQSQL